MRIAVLSDIHANREALEAVLQDIAEQSPPVDRIWFLGDAVGYGPSPVEAVQFVQTQLGPDDWVLGNHDALLARLAAPGCEIEGVAIEARLAINLNRQTMAFHPEANAFWRAAFRSDRIAQRVHQLDGLDHVLVHANQAASFSRYLYPWSSALLLCPEIMSNVSGFDQTGRPRVQWFGHSHVPALIRAERAQATGACVYASVPVRANEVYELGSVVTLINPGSVGQPRDLDRRAAYAILDTGSGTVVFHRVGYDWRRTAQLLSELGYPDSLVYRLKTAPLSDTAPPEWRGHFRTLR